VGGLLLSVSDWPAIFLINFIFISASLALSLKVLPKDLPRTAVRPDFDYTGVFLFAAVIVSWISFLLSWSKTPDWWLLLASLGLTALFYRYESGRRLPFIDVQAFRRNMNVNSVYLQFILVNVIFYSLFFGMPTYLQSAQHYSAKATGIIMLSLAGFGVVATPLAARIINRSGTKPALLAGALGTAAGSLLLVTLYSPRNPGWIFAVLAVLGISNAFNNLGLQTALYSFVSQAETGAASGLFMTSRYIGTILSSALLAIVFGKTVSSESFTAIAVASVIISLLLTALTLRLPNRKPAEAGGKR
jgi:predicted MFS family arabinose efflux permease